MIVIMVCLNIRLMVVRLYMYINPFIVPTVTGFGVPFEVMEAQSMHTINYPYQKVCDVNWLVRGIILPSIIKYSPPS